MTTHHRRPQRAFLVLALGVAVVPPAQAITFDILGPAGEVVGVLAPTPSDWVLAPGSTPGDLAASQGGGFDIVLDRSRFGAFESDAQNADIFGAGVLLPASDFGYRVNFAANLRTWDSYNDGQVVPPLAGASVGLWDLFAVNANTAGYYWNVTQPVDDRFDPLVPSLPAGSPVSHLNPTNSNASLPGATWAWGGRDFAAGYFESIRTNASVTLAASAPVYVSFVLDTRTAPQADNSLPSWGAFGPAGNVVEVPDGASGSAPGASPSNPLLPVGGQGAGGQFTFGVFDVTPEGPGAATFLFVDPVVAVGYEYEVSGGPSFLEVLLPTLGDPDGYGIEIDDNGTWVLAGTVSDGGSFVFGTGVQRFRVMGIDPALGLDPENPVAFVTGLKFDGPGPVELRMTAVTVAVPEPGTYATMVLGLALLGAGRARRMCRAPAVSAG